MHEGGQTVWRNQDKPISHQASSQNSMASISTGFRSPKPANKKGKSVLIQRARARKHLAFAGLLCHSQRPKMSPTCQALLSADITYHKIPGWTVSSKKDEQCQPRASHVGQAESSMSSPKTASRTGPRQAAQLAPDVKIQLNSYDYIAYILAVTEEGWKQAAVSIIARLESHERFNSYIWTTCPTWNGIQAEEPWKVCRESSDLTFPKFKHVHILRSILFERRLLRINTSTVSAAHLQLAIAVPRLPNLKLKSGTPWKLHSHFPQEKIVRVS